MTKPNSSHIVVILDRSGSMLKVQEDTIGGFNSFLAEQRKLKNNAATMTLVQFDDQYQVDYDTRPLVEVPDLSKESFVPRGMTALVDAIGRTIVSTGEALKKKTEEERPARVVVVVMTDGQENSSHEYNMTRVQEMIKHQRDKYAWEFVFMGASEDSIKDAVSYGFAAGSTAQYSSTGDGTKRAFVSLSDSMSRYRLVDDGHVGAMASNFFDGKNDLTDENAKKIGDLKSATKTVAGTGPTNDVDGDESGKRSS